ncbi:hypothetical protein [Phaeodactylibacter xiamenensis]|uniref:hypothetical protein n=1 Tax=Phaeodactylibacter xiamenensis TaxID=1524460 RepID=UPI003BA859EF
MIFSIILILSLFLSSSDHISEIATLNAEAEIIREDFFLNNHYSAKAYYNPYPWEVGGTARRLLHEFDCSVPRWRKQHPITYCAISSNIDLVLYELENYQGEYRVLSGSSSLNGFPEKFKTPGSVEVLYKGNRKCISTIGRENSNTSYSQNSNRPNRSPSNLSSPTNEATSPNTETSNDPYAKHIGFKWVTVHGLLGEEGKYHWSIENYSGQKLEVKFKVLINLRGYWEETNNWGSPYYTKVIPSNGSVHFTTDYVGPDGRKFEYVSAKPVY